MGFEKERVLLCASVWQRDYSESFAAQAQHKHLAIRARAPLMRASSDRRLPPNPGSIKNVKEQSHGTKSVTAE
jgi:hypothetical protein